MESAVQILILPFTLIEALKANRIEAGNVRFEDSVAQEYLHHLKETGIDDQLHHEDLMNRDRLVAFADAGYTTVDDLLGTADPIDISKDTGVDRDVVSSIATNHLDGLSFIVCYRNLEESFAVIHRGVAVLCLHALR
jgi:hypothetical protein